MQHLASGNTIAVPQLLSCLSGLPLHREQNILVDLVKRATALVIDRNLIASANRYGKPILGAHLERYLIDAMRRLVVSNAAWAPNQEKARVWYGSDGLFIVWPNAVNEIRKVLEDDELPGIPKSPETILEILLGAGVFEARSTGQALWPIAPPPGKNIIEAVKLSSPEILLSTHSSTAPLTQALVARAPAAALPSNPAVPTPSPRASAPLSVDPTAGPAQPSAADHTASRIPIASEPPEPLPLASELAESAPDAQTPLFFKLNAPMRLNPQVRDALSSAVDTLNGDPHDSLAITVPTGVFIPLDHFKRSRIDIPVLLRALSETRMTAGPVDGSRGLTVQHELRGQAEAGIVLRPSFVHGLDPADFTSSP